jgi:predicted TPR repeat methyltransferase
MQGWVSSAKKFDRIIFKKLRDQYHDALGAALADCQSLLDVGCGASSPIEHLQRRIPHAVGVDLFEPWLAKSKERHVHDQYVTGDVLKLDELFEPRSFDCVLAADLLEHLTETDGLRLLGLMEKVASKKVIIFTPNGFIEQHESDGNPFQVHRSGWTAKQMQAMGYEVIGLKGWRPLRGEYAQARWRPRVFWGRMSLLSQPLVTSRPNLAFAILCVKKVDSPKDWDGPLTR